LTALLHAYDELVLKRPAITLFVIALVVSFFAYHAPAFRLDASADSLVLENDEALQYYRSIRARYGSDDYLIVTYTPNQDLFSPAVLDDLKALRDEIAAMDNVESVISLLDVPLIQSPPISLAELSEEVPTLESPRTDTALAREEFLSSPMYRNLIIGADGRTTAMQINFRRDDTWHRLLKQRNELREKNLSGELTSGEQATLGAVSAQFDAHSLVMRDQQSADIAEVRSIIDRHRDSAELHLGGVPMIVSDSIDFIRHDLLTFGIGVLCFLIVILAVAFRKPRWVVLPMLACAATGIIMVGFLGFAGWPVTVVSSNFISLLLILTLSLAIHLVVRYRELHEASPDADQGVLVREMVRAKTVPCLYTAITTMVAFGSLLFSGIRPPGGTSPAQGPDGQDHPLFRAGDSGTRRSHPDGLGRAGGTQRCRDDFSHGRKPLYRLLQGIHRDLPRHGNHRSGTRRHHTAGRHRRCPHRVLRAPGRDMG
jgi:predicted RND superfamily exporter protein